MTPTDAQIEAAFERAWFDVHRCTIITLRPKPAPELADGSE